MLTFLQKSNSSAIPFDKTKKALKYCSIFSHRKFKKATVENLHANYMHYYRSMTMDQETSQRNCLHNHWMHNGYVCNTD